MAIDEGTHEARLRHLENAVADLEHRLREVEIGGFASASAIAASDTPLDATGAPAAVSVDAVTVLPLVGRTFMAFGGAFLLRALTDSERLPASAGVPGSGCSTRWPAWLLRTLAPVGTA